MVLEVASENIANAAWVISSESRLPTCGSNSSDRSGGKWQSLNHNPFENHFVLALIDAGSGGNDAGPDCLKEQGRSSIGAPIEVSEIGWEANKEGGPAR